MVSNITDSATEQTLAEFFSFCGKIEKIQFIPPEHKASVEDEPRKAIVTFATSDAAHTALLLSNAHIIDRAIVVESHSEDHPIQDTAPSCDTGECGGIDAPPQTFSLPTSADTRGVITITEADETYLQRNYGCVPDSMRSKTSVVASLIAAGYVLGEDIVQKAKEFDSRGSVVDQVKSKAHELEETYRLSGRLKEFGDKVTDAVKRVDDSLKFSETMEKVIAHPSVSSGLNQLKVVGSQIGDAMKSTLDAQIREVGIAIEERHAARAAQHPQQPSDSVAEPSANQEANIEKREENAMENESLLDPSSEASINPEYTPLQ